MQSDLVKSLGVGQIVDDKSAVGAAVEGPSERATMETLLGRSAQAQTGEEGVRCV